MSTTTFSYTGSLQHYIVTKTDTYTIVADGAQGGGLAGSGGKGAAVTVEITLPAGTVLDILVGGSGRHSGLGNGSGGGGSFVAAQEFGTDVAIAVGGGGGGNGSGLPNPNGGPGLATSADSLGGSGNMDALSSAAGGGGFSGSGGPVPGFPGSGGSSFLSGGAGGSGPQNGFSGGYGGGGGTEASGPQAEGGGGGGYQGGNAGTPSSSGGTGGGSYFASTALSETVSGGVNSGNGFVTITELACYRSGTRILTDCREVPIEDLACGDLVRTDAGGLRPIVWVGHRRIDCRRHPGPWAVWPVRVRPGAFGANLPHADLWLSPDHAVFVGGVLVPIRLLENGATIVRAPVERVTYWHVELASHDILLAEGLPAESWLDTGNRAMFDNAPETERAAPADAEQAWEQCGCAERVERGPNLAALRRRLSRRAASLGWARSPALEIAIHRPGALRIALPPSVERAHLVSPSRRGGVDRRRLGALLGEIRLDDVVVAPACYASGFHTVERHDGATVRWTDGEATLAIAAAPWPRLLEVEVAAVLGDAC